MGNLNHLTDIWVVTIGNRKNAKPKLEVFTDTRIDDIIEIGKRRPIIPIDSKIIDIGVGKSFEMLYRKKYKL
jgi:hypothetical protein